VGRAGNLGWDALAAARELAFAACPPAAAALRKELAAATLTLRQSDAAYRPPGPSGTPGGLVRFDADRPVMVLADVHARPGYLLAALEYEPPGSGAAMASLLAEGRAGLCVLGDVLHSEGRGARQRWSRAYEEYLRGYPEPSPAMDSEMSAALAALRIVLALTVAFPGRFACLKGNHDNLAAVDGDGDRLAIKFAHETPMAAAWMRSRYGQDMLAAAREYERSLPLMAAGTGRPRGMGWAASHAEPARALDADGILGYHDRPDVVYSLIWTDNGSAENDSVRDTLAVLEPLGIDPDGVWLGGHRHVDGRWAARQGGRFLQIHGYGQTRAALIPPGRRFDPNRDIIDLEEPRPRC